MNKERSSVNDLAKACAHSTDVGEWQELVRRCAPLASVTALRVSRMWIATPSQTLVEDIVQEVFLKLCEQERRILREFEPRGDDSFLGLLRTVSASVANDYFRRLYSVKRGGKVITMPLADGEGQSPTDGLRPAARVQQAALLAELDQILRSAPDVISERDRGLFWLYYMQGYTAEEIANLSAAGLTPKGVESALRRVAAWLRKEVLKRSPGARVEFG